MVSLQVFQNVYSGWGVVLNSYSQLSNKNLIQVPVYLLVLLLHHSGLRNM
jgi:hypothetical protein